jgi:hypothetical protein
MMKKLLLFAAVAGMSLSAGAQNVDKAALKALKQTRTQAMVSPVAVEQDKPSMFINPNKVGPRKTVLSNLWYTRPEGSLLITSTSTGSSKYSYVLYAPFVDQTFVNRSEDKDETTWWFGENQITESNDEDNNLVYAFEVPPAGYVNYLPSLRSHSDEFTYGQEVSSSNYSLCPDSIYSMTDVNRNPGYWTGFSDGYVFGTHDIQYVEEEGGEQKTAWCDYITEYFDKPSSPLYVTDFWFHFVSSSKCAIPEGTEMTLKVLKVLEDGSLDLEEPIATIPFTMADTLYAEVDDESQTGAFLVSQKEEDAFGSVTEVPFVIEDEFAVRIEGFHQPGVDFSLLMADVLATKEDSWEYGGVVYPTVYSYVNEAGEYVGSNRQYVSEETATAQRPARQYNAVMFIDGMYDVAKLSDEGQRLFIAPEEGGIIYTDSIYEYSDGTFDHSKLLEVQTTLPWLNTWEGAEPDEENYYIYTDEEEWPDWCYVTGFSDQYFADYEINVLQFACDKLPKGMKGRQFTFHVGSDKGADTGIITVRQGEPELDAIATTTATAKRDAHAYNLAGVMTKGNFKGLVIKDGKKMMKK